MHAHGDFLWKRLGEKSIFGIHFSISSREMAFGAAWSRNATAESLRLAPRSRRRVGGCDFLRPRCNPVFGLMQADREVSRVARHRLQR